MICQTVRAGSECAFMTPNGCGYNGGTCHPIVEKCEGCQKIITLATGKYCSVFPNPSIKWRNTICNMATHVKIETSSQQQEKINPLKASKRSAKGKK
ncbi:MAG: PxxKW family cysteine-rich protein [Thermodesulforhabdaceae bacterium]|jgi:hypothetical protein